MKPFELNITLRSSLPHRVVIDYSGSVWTCETYRREHTALAYYTSTPHGSMRRRKISKTQLASWTEHHEVFGTDGEQLEFFFYGDASAPKAETTTREYTRRISLFGNWLKKNRFQTMHLSPIDIRTSSGLHRLTAHAARFVECFELVFDHDWDMTAGCLRIDEAETMWFITPGHTFLYPNVDDESNNWANRGALLEAYRELSLLLEKSRE